MGHEFFCKITLFCYQFYQLATFLNYLENQHLEFIVTNRILETRVSRASTIEREKLSMWNSSSIKTWIRIESKEKPRKKRKKPNKQRKRASKNPITNDQRGRSTLLKYIDQILLLLHSDPSSFFFFFFTLFTPSSSLFYGNRVLKSYSHWIKSKAESSAIATHRISIPFLLPFYSDPSIAQQDGPSFTLLVLFPYLAQLPLSSDFFFFLAEKLYFMIFFG